MIKDKIKKDWIYIGFALTVYILALPLNGFLKLPFVGNKLQLPEIVFVFLSILAFFKVLKHKSWLKWQTTNVDKALIIYGLALLVSCLGHPTKASFFEVLGFGYLAILYVIINLYLVESGKDIRAFLVNNTQISGIISALLGILGLVLLGLNHENILVGYYPNYPVFGDIYRLKALATEPIMLNSVLGVFILVSISEILSVEKIRFSLKRALTFTLMGIVMFLTFTKSIVMCGASVLVIIAMRYHCLIEFKKIVWGLLFVVFIFFSHLVFVKKSDFEQNKYCHAIEKKPLTEINNSYLLRTCYGVLKEANSIVFSRYPICGIGGGNFTAYMNQLKKESLYPTYLTSFDPLSTYFGALSELGLIGFVSLLYLYFVIGSTWEKVCFTDINTNGSGKFWLLIGGVLLFMVAEGFVTDTMNFRHYWLIISCLAAQERISNHLGAASKRIQ